MPIEDIIGRDDKADSLWKEAERSSLLMNDIRRFGKTSVLRLMENRAPIGWYCVRTTVEAARSTSVLVEKTFLDMQQHAGLVTKIGYLINSFVDKTDPKIGFQGLQLTLKSDFQANAWKVFQTVLKNLNEHLKEDDMKLLIIWDEFPAAIRAIAKKEGPDSAEDVLALFRSLREDDNSDRIRWLLAGSVGFHHVLRYVGGHGAEINDLQRVEIGTLSKEWAAWMLKCLLVGIQITWKDSQIAEMSKVSGGIPYILMMIAKHVEINNCPLPDSAEQAQDLLLSAASDPSLKDNWTPLLERITDYYAEEFRDIARVVLDAVASNKMTKQELTDIISKELVPVPDINDMKKTLDLLIADHYLKYDRFTDSYSWKHEPLCAIWKGLNRINE